MILRNLFGWFVAIGYALIGARRRALCKYDRPQTVLSIVTHHPSAKALENLLCYLTRNGFSFVSSDELLEMQTALKPWRPRIAWFTFDDGSANFERDYLPILEKYHVPVSLFISPEETRHGVAWSEGLSFAERHQMFSLPTHERYLICDKKIKTTSSVRPLASEDALMRLAQHPLVTLENHTMTHLSCAMRPIEEVLKEVDEAQEILTQWTGRAPRWMAYPFGHYTPEIDAALRARGLTPVTIDPGITTLATLGRTRNMFYDRTTTAENIARILGAWPCIKPLNQRLNANVSKIWALRGIGKE